MSTSTTRAGWLRGALVGACSALVTVVAHAWAGGAPPQGGAVVLLVAVCATAGAAVAGTAPEGRHARAALITATLPGGRRGRRRGQATTATRPVAAKGGR